MWVKVPALRFVEILCLVPRRHFMSKISALLLPFALVLSAVGCSAAAGEEDVGSEESALAGVRLHCASEDHRYNSCEVDRPIRSVRLGRQVSRTGCVQNTTWGFKPG